MVLDNQNMRKPAPVPLRVSEVLVLQPVLENDEEVSFSPPFSGASPVVLYLKNVDR